ncbi:MAG: lysophospholipid acyltransferase family protein [Bacteroidales bacterium]
MLKLISRIYLKLIGWKITGSFPEGLKKCVIIAAPHTSNLDFIIGRAGFYNLGIKRISFLIKKEMFKFPLGSIIKTLGGIPVDRGRSNNMVIAISKMFKEKENLFLIITPEGTRKYVENWKKGFYHIAINAKVPIVLSYVDYGKKEGGIGPVLYPTGNFEEDFKFIEDFYRTKTAKYPEMFNLSPIGHL